MGIRRHVTLFAGLLVLSGCATVATELPEIDLSSLDRERVSQEVEAYGEIDRLHARLWDVAYPVLRDNASLCPKTRPDIGVVTFSLKSYPDDMKAAAKREFNAKDYPTVRRVIKGSPADKAGIKVGDTLVSPESKPMSAIGKDMRKLLQDGAKTELRVSRGKESFNVEIVPQNICDYGLKLSMRSTVNAYANGRSMTMTSGMMNFTKSDDELALIVAHELAHNTMAHVRKIVGNLILSGFATRYTRPFETEADYVGLYYLVRAGYDAEATSGLWARMALMGPRSVGRAKTHPTYPDRVLRLAATRKEIAAKQAAGEPLVPNFKTPQS
jgi:hypothetical protein